MNIALPSSRRLTYYAFVAAIWLPLIAVLCSPQLRPFTHTALHDPSSIDEARNRLRIATPLWNRAVAFYNDALYALGTSGRPGAAVVGSGGWVFLGDIFNNNFSQALGRRVLDDREVADWTNTVALETRWLATRKIPSAFVVAPAKWSIYPDRLPWWTRGAAPTHSLDRILAAHGDLPLIDVRDALREARNHADTYSALNSHWTDYGAWVAWTRIAPALSQQFSLPDLPVPTLKSLSISDEQNEFASMLNITAANEWTKYEPAKPFSDYAIVNADGSTTPRPGNAETNLLDLPRITRNDHAANRTRVLVLRDSSANSLSPFLQNAFYMTYQIDHKLGEPRKWPNLAALVERFRPDAVLWVMTERYLNEPAGDIDYWRAATAYDCAEARPIGTWPDAPDTVQLVNGPDALQQHLVLPREIGAPIVIRITVSADRNGTLTLDSHDASGAAPQRVNFSQGLSELFFKLDRVQRPERLTLTRDEAGLSVDALEIKSGGCLGSANTQARAATNPDAAPSAVSR